MLSLGAEPSESKARQAIDKYFSPEFLGRLDDVVCYNRLDESVADALIERYRTKYATLSRKTIEFTEEDIKEIKNASKIEQFGARDLDHNVKTQCMKVLKRQPADKKQVAKKSNKKVPA